MVNFLLQCDYIVTQIWAFVIQFHLHPLTTEVEAEMALLDASGMGGPDVVMPTLVPGGRNRAQ